MFDQAPNQNPYQNNFTQPQQPSMQTGYNQRQSVAQPQYIPYQGYNQNYPQQGMGAQQSPYAYSGYANRPMDTAQHPMFPPQSLARPNYYSQYQQPSMLSGLNGLSPQQLQFIMQLMQQRNPQHYSYPGYS